MSLEELVDNTRTDKNTVHSYLPLYDELLSSRKETIKNVLEIGIFKGGSIKLWSDFFPNAHIYGVDIMDENQIWEGIKNKDNITLFTSTNAYDVNFVLNSLVKKNLKFDFLLNDGLHTLDSIKIFIGLYSQLLTDDGLLIIEDIHAWHWVDILKNYVPENLKKFVKVYDLRKKKKRFDDIVFVIDKSLNV